MTRHDHDDDADLDTIDLGSSEFRRLASIARTITPDDHRLDAPPPGLWDAIATQLRSEQIGAPVLAARREPTLAASEVSPITAARSARRRSPLMAVAAAAGVVIVAALAALVALGGNDGDTGVVEAATSLLSLDGSDTELARAEVVDTGDGLEVHLDLAGLEFPEEGYLELWVIDPDVVRMHSLGVVAGGGTFALPAGLDPADFPVVDISVEPIDGDPTHSGVSVARGVLAPVG